MTTAEMEALSKQQQAEIAANMPIDGSYFLLNTGGGSSTIYQRQGNKIIPLTFDYPDSPVAIATAKQNPNLVARFNDLRARSGAPRNEAGDNQVWSEILWAGKTIGSWQAEQTAKGIAALKAKGITVETPPLNGAYINDLLAQGKLIQGTGVSDIDKFITQTQEYKPSGILASITKSEDTKTEKQLNTSLVDIWSSRPDLQQAFPQGTQAGTPDNSKLNNWWNEHGVKEYPNTTLVAPGSPLVTAPKTIEEQQGIPRPTIEPTAGLPPELVDFNQQMVAGDTSVESETLLPVGTATREDVTNAYTSYIGREPTEAEYTHHIGKTGLDDLNEWAMKQEWEGTTPPENGGGGGEGGGGGDGAGVEISNKEFLDYLTSIGIDPSQVSQDNLLLASIAYESMKTLEQTGQVVDPELVITEEHASAFLGELEKNPLVNKKFYEFAQAELGPYYQQKIDFAKQDLTRELEDIKRQYGEGIEDIGETTAETGLAFSGIRKKQETDLAGSATRLAGGLGRAAERQYGSSALGGFTSPTIGTTPLYTLSGGIEGELEKERETAEKTYAQEIEEVYRQRKAGQEYI